MKGTPEEERLADIEAALERLRETAESGTVVVEGARDLAALSSLGVGGRHVAAQRGWALAELAEDLVRGPPPVVLLMDWDRSGGRLQARLADLLAARIPLDLEARRRLASCCHSRSLEEVPAELAALRRAVLGGRHQGLHG